MQFDVQYLTSLISLFLAAILGGVIGFERAGTNHDAGLRTHILVCLGSATVMVLSRYLREDYNIIDITRLGAQVISGIGFLGVGCIIVTGDRIKGLTTAAGLWTTACVGLVVGMGYYLIAITVVFLMLVAILGLRPIAMRFQDKSYDISISITLSDRNALGNLFIYLSKIGIETTSVKIDDNFNNQSIIILIDCHTKKALNTGDLIGKVCMFEGVENLTFI